MTILYRGPVTKAYLEIDPMAQNCQRVLLFLDTGKWIELTGISINNGFILPSPIGCECTVTDISDRQLDGAKFEIEFASSYSRDGVFWANAVRETDEI